MLLYVCRTCGRWQDLSFAKSISAAFAPLAKFGNTEAIEPNTACPAGHGLMVIVQAGERLFVQDGERKEGTPEQHRIQTYLDVEKELISIAALISVDDRAPSVDEVAAFAIEAVGKYGYALKQLIKVLQYGDVPDNLQNLLEEHKEQWRITR